MPEDEKIQDSKLLEELDLLKTEYIKLLNDKDVMLNWGKPQLEALYNTKIGCFKLEHLQAQFKVKSMKRTIEMIWACINKEEPIDFDVIELMVSVEMSAIEDEILLQGLVVKSGKDLLSNLNSPQRSAELRNIFRQLAKQLHPDVNPDMTDEQKKIWQLAMDAYKYGDVDKLKALTLVYEKEIKGNEIKLTNTQLELAIESLKQGCKILQHEIDAMKEAFPFNIEQNIKDEEWVETEVETIKTAIEKLLVYENELKQEYHYLRLEYGQQ